MDPWISLLAEVGFPIAVTFYLLHRIEGKLDVLIESIDELPNHMEWTSRLQFLAISLSYVVAKDPKKLHMRGEAIKQYNELH